MLPGLRFIQIDDDAHIVRVFGVCKSRDLRRVNE